MPASFVTIKVSSVLATLWTLGCVTAIANPAPVSGVSVQLSSHLLKRQSPPSVGDKCPIPGSNPFDVVCVVTVEGDLINTRCAETCCYVEGEFVGGCGAGESCMIDASGTLQGCCPGPDPDACDRPSPCVNADQPPQGNSTPCPSATPICFTKDGAPGCSGSFTDIFTKTATNSAVETTTEAESTETTSTAIQTSESSVTETLPSATSTVPSYDTSITTPIYTSTSKPTGVMPTPTTNATITRPAPPPSTGSAPITSSLSVVGTLLVSWLVSMLML